MTDFASPPGYKLVPDHPLRKSVFFRLTEEDHEQLVELGRALGGLSPGQAARWVIEQQSVQNLITLTLETAAGER